MDHPGYTGSLPLMAYNFKVVMGFETIGFAKVSGLSREFETLTYRHGMSFMEGERAVRYRQDKYVPITFERGFFVEDVGELASWVENGDETSMSVSLCDATGLEVMIWNIAKAFPVKLTAPTLDADSSGVAIGTLEVMASGISIQSGGSLFG